MQYIGVGTGMNSLIRPALYGSYHEIVNLSRSAEAPSETVTVVGPICETGDRLGSDRLLPPTKEGDVILKIDGRKPSSVNHCMRILGSYQPGEKLVLNIMRDKQQETIEIEVPDDRTSQLFNDLSDRLDRRFEDLIELVKPVRAALPAPAPAPVERT